MKVNKKFALLNAVVCLTGMNEKEIEDWLKSRQTLPTRSTKPIFPIVYIDGGDLEILPNLDLSRKDEIWGFEILPGILLAKKCDYINGIVGINNWDSSKSFVTNCCLNGKRGSLPSKQFLKKKWTEKLVYKIQAMDKFLCENGVDGEEYSTKLINRVGKVWCSDVDAEFEKQAYIFYLHSGKISFDSKIFGSSHIRMAMAF